MTTTPASRRPRAGELFTQTAIRLEAWTKDPHVLGVLLVGSKAQGHQDNRSDDDLEVLLDAEAFARLAPTTCHEYRVEGEGPSRRLIYDAQLTSLADLERKRDSALDLDHWPYERARVLFARDTRVRRAVEAAGRMEPEFRRLRLQHATVDAWVAPRRAIKTLERGFEAAGALLVARGAKALTRVLFALEWRWVPLDHWLEREIATLKDEVGAGTLGLAALSERRPEALIEALDRLEDRLAAEGVARPAERTALFLELIHVTRAEERARHGLA